MHNTWFVKVLTVGTGLTVIVKGEVIPVQVVPELVKVGVREIVAVTGAVVELVAMNEEISPVPLAASPIEVVELTQL